MKKLPVVSRAGRVRMWCAASATISGRRERAIAASPPSRFCTAAVAISVRGHSELNGDARRARSSAAMPSVHMLIPNFASV